MFNDSYDSFLRNLRIFILHNLKCTHINFVKQSEPENRFFFPFCWKVKI